MAGEHTFDLHRADIFATRDDDIFGAVHDLQIGVGVLDREIARVKEAALEGFGCGLGVFQIPFHDGMPADHDFALGLAVMGDGGHCVGIQHHGFVHHGHENTCARFDGIALLGGALIPTRAPEAFCDVAVCFGEAVDLCDVKPERLDRRQGCGGGRRACGEDLDGVIKAASVFIIAVDQRVEHDGRAAEVGDALIGDGIVNCLGCDVAATDDCAAQKRHHPCVVPAVAVKQRHDCQVDRPQGELPAYDSSHGHEVCAAVMVDDALRAACCARSIVECEAFPLILRHDPFERGIPASEEGFIFRISPSGGVAMGGIGDFDNLRAFAVHGRNGGLDRGQELCIDQRHFGFAVLEDVANGFDIEPCVDGIENGPCGRNGEMCLTMGRDIGQKRCDDIAWLNTCAGQSRGQRADAGMILGVCFAMLRAVGNSQTIGENIGSALEVRERRQGHKVCGVFIQASFIAHLSHCLLPVFSRLCRVRERLRAGRHI